MLKDFFGVDKPIIGMIHLFGRDSDSRFRQALEEIRLYQDEGVNGAIVENYGGASVDDVKRVIEELAKRDLNGFSVGVNILPNEYALAFPLAAKLDNGFIQLDHVAGVYEEAGDLDFKYDIMGEEFSEIPVFGGIWPKYYTPVAGSDLEEDLKRGMERANVLVVTGDGTGMETPMFRIRAFRRYCGEHPLIVGAGLSYENAREQLSIADGAIVGTSFKYDGRTQNRVDRGRVRRLIDLVEKLR